jgi:hypothetical protein
MFIDNFAGRDTEQRIDAFQKLIQSLPPPHQHLLLYLLDTLSLFASTASETKMDIPNLAAVFCPGILRHPDHNTPIHYKISQYVIEFLIEFQSLFTLQLLVATRKKSSTTCSSVGEIPPVPLLLPSSFNNHHPHVHPPAVPLHVVNTFNPSTIGSSSLSYHGNNSSFTESPLEINNDNNNQQITVKRKIYSSSSSSGLTTKESFMHRFTKIATPYYYLLREKFTDFGHTIELWISKLFLLSTHIRSNVCKLKQIFYI